MIKIHLALISFLLAVQTLFAGNDGFRFSLKLENNTDTVCYLAHYYGDKTYLDDTAYVQKNGSFVFEADTLLPEGMYIIAGQNKSRLLEFFVDNDKQQYSFEADKNNLLESLKVKKTEGNRLFYEYINYINSRQKDANPIRDKIQAFKESDEKDSLAFYEKQMQKVNEEVAAFTKDFLDKNKGHLAMRFLQAQQEIEIIETPVLENGRKDSSFQYHYYRKHFFDNLPLDDEALLRSPVYHKKLNQYIEKMVIHVPDTVITASEWIINQAKNNKETYRYTVWFLTNFAERSQVMGMDKAFVHLADNYFATGEMDFWVHDQVKKNIVERATTLRPLLLGKPAPDLIMLDTAMRPVSLYSVRADYTILFFWDTDCGFCKRETPKLKKFFDEQKDSLNIEVFGICADTSMKVMKNYIQEKKLEWINVNGPRSLTGNYHDAYDVHSTPVMYVLDKEKNIVAKRILTDQIVEFIPRHRRQKLK